MNRLLVFVTAALLALLVTSKAQAGLGPENVCLVVNSRSWASRTIANHYATLRDIPPGNIVEVAWSGPVETTSLDEFRLKILTPVLMAIQQRGLAPQIEAIVYSSDFPYAIRFRENETPADRLAIGSITALTAFAPVALAAQPTDFGRVGNPYAVKALSAKDQPLTGFGSRIARPGTNEGEPMYLSMMLAYTSGRGNSVSEAIDYLTRGAAADGTLPKGTIYFCQNADVRSKTREKGFADAVTRLKKLGIAAEVVAGELPSRKPDVQGAMLGVANFSWPRSQSKILPGAICEHLTSYGGILFPRKGQTPLSELLRYGATGTSGTVVEPYAIAAKFPDPMIQVFYAQGVTLAEAYYASVAAPYQLLIVGEPLCAPWARKVQVEVQGLAADESIDAPRSVKVAVPADATGYATGACEWFLDGVRTKRGKLEEPFDLDPAKLGAGWHELRAVVISSEPAAAQARAIVPFQVNANGKSNELAIKIPAAARFGAPIEVELAAPAATAIELFHDATSLGKVRGAKGKLTVNAALLGMGPARLFARTQPPAGQLPQSFAPQRIEIQSAAPLVNAQPPVDSNLARGIELEWGRGQSGVAQNTAVFTWLTDAGVPVQTPFTGTAWFPIEREGTYQFQVRFNGQFALSVDGQPLFNKNTRFKEQHFIPVALQPGMHLLKIEGKSLQNANCDLRFGDTPVDFLEGQQFRHVR